MRALDRKLVRDLGLIKGQAIAIAFVIGAGVATFVMSFSNFESLAMTRDAYYGRYRLADVFASLKRAPLSLGRRIERIPGVSRTELRTVVDVTLDVKGFSEPVSGRLISIPEHDRDTLNDLCLRKGRYIEPDRPDEVLVSEGFALAHHLSPGDEVAAVINGRRRKLCLVGIVLSPEYVYSIPPGGLLPDDRRFGVFWMSGKALSAAFDMEGGFNDVALSLTAGAMEKDVIDRLDRVLEPYGGLGAIPRSLQTSNWYLVNELAQLQTMGAVVPVIFLAVAALLLNVVLSRIVSIQREQIAALKALGYSNLSVGAHYSKTGLLIAFVGAAFGTFGGAKMGYAVAENYSQFFRFPVLQYELSGGIVLGAFAVSLLASFAGTLGAVRRAVRLPPAEAMRPEPPATYRVSWIERMGLQVLLSQPSRMILRNLGRRPWRTAVSVIGVAFSVAILIVGMFTLDSLDVILDVTFNVAQRQDVTVSFVQPESSGALYEVTRLPGVMESEPMRVLPVRLRHGPRSRQVAVTGLAAGARLSRVIDRSSQSVSLPPEGLVLSTKLAEILDVQPSETITLEVLEGARPVREVAVTGLVEEFLGTSAYMDLDAMRRLMREGKALSGTFLKVDGVHVEELYRLLKETPAVAGIALKRAAVQSFEDTLAQHIGVIIGYNIFFAGVIAFGVVYNSARICLSERSRDMASLRVMGFTRAEISIILLGELAAIVGLAIPVGMGLGYGLSALTSLGLDTELYRIPLIVAPRTWLFAGVTVALAAAFSGLVVRRRLDRLDLIAVLKTRE